MDHPYKLSASLICGDPLKLERELAELAAAPVDGLHFDVMDGMFVPRYGLYPEMLKAIKSVSNIPVDVHLMIEEPVRYAQVFLDAGADIFVMHAESTRHLDHAIRTVKKLGGRAGVALNPATPLSVLDYVLDDIELICLMAINPGIVGHKLIPGMMDKIAGLKKKIAGHPHITIEIDGGVSPESAPQMVRNGASLLVCGTSSIYKTGQSLTDTVRTFRKHIDAELSRP